MTTTTLLNETPKTSGMTTQESPLEYCVRRAGEIGLSLQDLKRAQPIVYGSDEPVGLRNKKMCVSVDNKAGMVLRIGVRGELDAQKDNPCIAGWSAKDSEYEFSIIYDTQDKRISRSFTVSECRIVQSNKPKSKIFAVEADYKMAVDRILRIYARYKQ